MSRFMVSFLFLLIQLLSFSLQAQSTKTPPTTDFTFEGFSKNKSEIQTEGAAIITPDGLLRLTDRNLNVTGTAFYRKPILLRYKPLHLNPGSSPNRKLSLTKLQLRPQNPPSLKDETKRLSFLQEKKMYMANLQKLLLKTKRYLGNADARRDNVRNQREHLVCLLADNHIRLTPRPEFLNKLDDRAVDAVKTKFFKNYKNWCKFLGRKHILSIVTGKNIKPSYGGDDEAFLLKSKNATGKAAHSDWSNYDDLYEYFWSPDCFYLGWPMRDDGDLSPVSSLQQLFYASSREITITLFLPSILGILDIILNFSGFHRWKFTEILRNILKIAVSLAWCVVLPLCDAQSNSSAPGMLKQWISFLPRDVKGVPPLHILAVALCLLPNVLTAIMFIFPMLRRWIENSDWNIIRLHVWWSQKSSELCYVLCFIYCSANGINYLSIFYIFKLHCMIVSRGYLLAQFSSSNMTEPPQTSPAILFDVCNKRQDYIYKSSCVHGSYLIVSSLVLLGVVAFFMRKRKTSNAQRRKNLKALTPLKHYRYREVKRFTNSFACVVGKGGFATVYKGNLPDGRKVAVKVLKDTKSNGEEDFINEVVSMSQTSHVNIVSLVGFCYEGSKRMIVYEFLENGSLDQFISKRASSVAEWRRRLYEILLGVARGLEYLHYGCKTRIVHFDIKPQNVLLDSNLCPKVSDFGLAKLCEKKESIMSLLDTRETIGYIAPEMISRVYGGVSHNSIYFPDWI
ncbi:unnamed protein product [Brassica oleracea]